MSIIERCIQKLTDYTDQDPASINKPISFVDYTFSYHSCYLSSMTGNGTNSGRKQSLNIKLFKESGIDDKQLEYISSSSSSTSTNLPQIHTTAPPTLPIRRKSFKLNAKSSRFQNKSPSERRSYSPQSSKHSQASYETDDYFDHPSSEDSLTQSDSDLDQSESSDYDYDVGNTIL